MTRSLVVNQELSHVVTGNPQIAEGWIKAVACDVLDL